MSMENRTVNISDTTRTRLENYIRPDSPNVQADTHEFLTKALKDLHRKVESRFVSKLYHNPQQRSPGMAGEAVNEIQLHNTIFEGITARAVTGKSHDDVINEAIDAYELRLRKAPLLIGTGILAAGFAIGLGIATNTSVNENKLPPVPKTTTTHPPAPTTTSPSTSTSVPTSTSTTGKTNTPTTYYQVPHSTSPSTTSPLPSTTTSTALPHTTTTTTTAPTKYTVKIIFGACKPGSGAGKFTQGQKDTLKAIVPSGYYVWGGWTGSGSGSYTGPKNPVTITVRGNITETANCYYNPPPPTTTTTTSPPPTTTTTTTLPPPPPPPPPTTTTTTTLPPPGFG